MTANEDKIKETKKPLPELVNSRIEYETISAKYEFKPEDYIDKYICYCNNCFSDNVQIVTNNENVVATVIRNVNTEEEISTDIDDFGSSFEEYYQCGDCGKSIDSNEISKVEDENYRIEKIREAQRRREEKEGKGVDEK